MDNPWVVSIVGGIVSTIIGGLILSFIRGYGGFPISLFQIATLFRACMFGLVTAALVFIFLTDTFGIVESLSILGAFGTILRIGGFLLLEIAGFAAIILGLDISKLF